MTNTSDQPTCCEALGIKLPSRKTVSDDSSGTVVAEPERDAAPSYLINQSDADVERVRGVQAEGKQDYVVKPDHTIAARAPDLAFGALLRSADFHLLLWSFTLVTGAALVHVNNITVTSLSAGLSRHDQGLVVIVPVVNTIASIAIGTCSDVLAARIPRSTFILLGVVATSASSIFYVIFTTRYWALVVATALCGVSVGTLWSVTPALVSELFGLKSFGRNWGILLLMSGLTGMAAQAAFGAFYDDVTPPGQLTCRGGSCVRFGYITTGAVSVVSLVLAVAMDIRQRRKATPSL